MQTASPRLQAQLLTFPSFKLLWINGYIPCDPQLQDFDDTELVATLTEVELLVTAHTDCEIVWAADMNWDVSRDNHHTRTVSTALDRLGLTSVWKGRNIDFTHTHTDGATRSTIDHFLVSKGLLGLVEDCGPVHRGDNLSRHAPVFMSLKLGDLQTPEKRPHTVPRRMPAWDRAKLEELEDYKISLERKLQTIPCPESMLHCQDPRCGDAKHSEGRDKVVLDVLLSMVECSYTSIPLTGKTGGTKGAREIIPGCSTEVEPHRKVANTCYTAWVASGKPRQGPIFEAKLKSHARFRYAVRKVKRAKDLHKAQGLYEAAMSGDIELMKELRRVKTGKGEADELAETVDGVTGEREIANTFSKVYGYNSAGSKEEMEALQAKVQGLIGEENSLAQIAKVTPEVVKTAAVMMKPHKMDVSQGFSSEVLLHAPDLLFGLLSLIFRDWLMHGTVTKSVLVCAFIPLLKPGKDPACCDSYRAIAGSSLILKMFERCILLVWGDQLHSDSLQFGFKRKCSTGTATWLVQEVLQHYLRQGTKPVAVVLDCTKAFDLAKFSILFSRLL